MVDIINLLPDSVANQIAAGEVVQRPASVVKELVENSIDAEATTIQVIIKDAGRTLIQIIDNGKGMSETDARMSFERHATSKIKSANDLYSLHTMGFRGEALASIAAVAQVEMRTKRAEDELGTLVVVAGSQVEKQEPVSTPVGTNIMVKNLFFNVPARRKFLKSNTTEMNRILEDFKRIALIYPEINFVLLHNDTEQYNLKASNFHQRIIDVFGKKYQQVLLPLDVKTDLVTIRGYVAKPESATKGNNLQYFFINGRYMQHPYFYKAVMQAYDRMLQPDAKPSYFLRFEVEPATIDVNIHPTKTEIKFEHEQTIWPILSASVKEVLGKFIIAPALDFDQLDAPDIPVMTSDTVIKRPQTVISSGYNPFKSESTSAYKRTEPMDWELLYKGFNKSDKPVKQEEFAELESSISSDAKTPLFGEEATETTIEFIQYKNKYIITKLHANLVVINQRRAHIRILFERYLKQQQEKKVVSQQLLFPEMLELHPSDVLILKEIQEDIACIGFDLCEFGKNTFVINGIPSDVEQGAAVKIIQEIIDSVKQKRNNIKTELQEVLAMSLASSAAIPYGKQLNNAEMQLITAQLFECENQQYTPDGKIIAYTFGNEEIDKKFK